MPVQPAVFAVAVVTLQRVFLGLDHVGGRVGHARLGEAELSRVVQAGILRAQHQRRWPVEGRPEAALTGRARRDQDVVDRVVGLVGDVDLEREDLGGRVIDTPGRGDHLRRLRRIDGVAQQVTIGVVAVEPHVGRQDVLLVFERALDLEVSVVIFRQVLSGS